MTNETINAAIGCDHAGFPYKEVVIRVLNQRNIPFLDMGTDSEDSVDYPDFVHPVANAVEEGKASIGILICGSGNGVAMTANKHQGIRAALTWNQELAALARRHNNANVLCIPARFVSKLMAATMLQAFLDNKFEGGRHQRRVNKIGCVV